MEWNNGIAARPVWSGEIFNYSKKAEAAEKVSRFVQDGNVIGVGSGSTSYLALEKIAQRAKERGWAITAIPTSKEAEMNCHYFGVRTTPLLAAKPDWGFDGADEVDDGDRLLKGRGGALFAEKLVMASSPKTYILVDESKRVGHLGENFPVPVEVDPRAVHLVDQALMQLKSTDIQLRLATGKDGPVYTEAGNVILDVTFEEIPQQIEKEIICIPGVIETGLFTGYSVEILTV